MTDRNSLLKVVQQHLAAGRIHMAISEYQKLLKENPADLELIIQIGDLYLKINHTAQALEYFEKAVDRYCARGFLLKAIAILKRMMKLDPDQVDIPIRVAMLHHKVGNETEAKLELKRAIQQRLQCGQLIEMVRLINVLIELEPDNLLHHWELAQACERLGMKSQASGVYLRIGRSMAEKGLWKESLRPLEKAHALKPQDISVLCEMLRVLIEDENIDGSISVCHRITALDCSHYQTWQTLIKLYLLKGDQESYLKACSSLVDAYISRTMYVEAMQHLETLVTLEPQKSVHREKRNFVRSLMAEQNAGLVEGTDGPQNDVQPFIEIGGGDLLLPEANSAA